jgi:ABC-type polysaccharide/polyol phosphate export permease
MSEGISQAPLAQLTLTRIREFWREPEAVFWVFIFPILLAGGLGLAFRNQPAQVMNIGAESELYNSLRSDKGLAVEILDRDAGAQALRTGKIVLFAYKGSNGPVFRYDDTNPDGRIANLLAERAMRRSSGSPDPTKIADDLVREPGSRYIDFVVPGLLGMNLMGSGIWGLGFSIVDARRRKLLKRLEASPMKRWEYLASFLLSRLITLVIEVALLLCFASLVFDVPLRGPVWELGAFCLLSSLMFSSLGLLIASRVRTIEAASGLMNVVMLPMWVLSGVFFSSERFPDAIQPVIRLLPLTAVIDGLRSSMLQGVRLTEMAWQVPVVGLWLAASFFIAMRLFRWR